MRGQGWLSIIGLVICMAKLEKHLPFWRNCCKVKIDFLSEQA